MKLQQFAGTSTVARNFNSLQLITLISKIILEEAGFVINEILEDCKKQAEELRKKKDKLNQDSNAISLRNKYNDKSKKKTKTTIKEFTVIPKKKGRRSIG